MDYEFSPIMADLDYSKISFFYLTCLRASPALKSSLEDVVIVIRTSTRLLFNIPPGRRQVCGSDFARAFPEPPFENLCSVTFRLECPRRKADSVEWLQRELDAICSHPGGLYYALAKKVSLQCVVVLHDPASSG